MYNVWVIVGSCAFALMLAGCEMFESDPVDPHRAYLATYFLDNGQAGVYLAQSRDGLHFTPILEPNIPILSPKVGKERLTRDACILRGPDGTWHMVWTTGWNERGIGLAHSPDLVHWSDQQYVEVMRTEPDALNCWAPEIAYDPGRAEFLIFWSTTIRGRFPETEAGGDPLPQVKDSTGAPSVKPGTWNHRIYCTTTRDFKSFDPARLYYNPGFNCIDATLLAPESPGEGWHLFFKDETRFPPAKNIRHLALRDPQHPEGPSSSPITGAYWAEGPTAFRARTDDGDVVLVLFDRYAENRFGAVETADFERWTDITKRVSFPPGARHGTVVVVEPAYVEFLKESLRARQSQSVAAVAEPAERRAAR